MSELMKITLELLEVETRIDELYAEKTRLKETWKNEYELIKGQTRKGITIDELERGCTNGKSNLHSR